MSFGRSLSRFKSEHSGRPNASARSAIGRHLLFGVFLVVIASAGRLSNGSAHQILCTGSGVLAILAVAAAVVLNPDSLHEGPDDGIRIADSLRLTLEAANAGTWDWDVASHKTLWSEEIWGVLGIEPHSVTPSYEAWLDIVHPGDRARVAESFREAVESGRELSQEYRVRAQNGSERWLLARGRALRNSEGKTVRMAGIVLDITARKQSEEALQARERELRRFIEFAPVAIAMFDRDMRYLAASRRYLEDYGTENVLGRSHYEIFPEIPERWKQIHRRCLAGAVERHDGEQFVRADGSVQWVRWEIQPWHQSDGSVGGLVLFSEDITWQRQVNEALRVSEERLRLAQQVARIGTFEWDCRTGVTTWTPELEAMYGIEPGAFAQTKRDWEQFVHPGDRAKAANMLQVALESGRLDGELRIVRQDGTVRWIASRGWFYRDEHGQPLRMIGVNIDITEVKIAEEEIRFRAALHQAVGEIFAEALSCDSEPALGGAILGTVQSLTCTSEGFLGEFDSEGRLMTIAGDATLVDADERTVIRADLLHDGQPFGIMAVGNRIGSYRARDREAIGAIAPVAVQVFMRKRAEDNLRRVSEQQRLAMEAAQFGAWDYRFDSGKVVWDETSCTMFGIADQNPTYDEALSRIHPEDRPRVERAMRQALDGIDGGAYHEDFRVVLPDGRIHWISAHAQVMFGGEREPLSFTGVNLNVTRQKEAELEIRQLNAQLEQRVVRRTQQLEAANEELEKFAYSVSHDLRAPLRGIEGWSAALAEDYASQLDGRAQRYLERVRSETRHMGRLIDDLLQLSRVARTELQFLPVDLTAAAHTIAAELADANSGRELDFVIEPGLSVLGDRRLLEIALTNLFDNAVKFTGPRTQARIEFGRGHSNGCTEFFVRDNGVGFDMTYSSGLFRPFERLHRTTEFPGTGIGLATVQRVIHRHGGRIWAEAQVDSGATFHFTIGEAP